MRAGDRERRQRDRPVGEQLDQHATRGHHDHRPEPRVAHQTHRDLHARGHLAVHRHRGPEARGQVVVRRRHRGRVGQTQQPRRPRPSGARDPAAAVFSTTGQPISPAAVSASPADAAARTAGVGTP